MPRRFVLVLLIGGLLSATPALSQARSLYYGMSANTRSPGSVGAADAAAETGVTRIREDLAWSLVEPSDDNWDWSKPDLMYEEAAERGLSILPIPNSPPCWAVWIPTDCDERFPSGTSEYAEFVAQVAARYGPEGAFWDAHPELDPNLASRHIEIWNEPYWATSKESMLPFSYAYLYKAAVVAGRSVNPATRYLIESAMGGSGGVKWLAGIYSAEPSIGSYIDGIAVHPYPGSHGISYAPISITDEAFLNAKINYEEWKARGVNKPVWITEVGYSSCSDPDHCVPGSSQAARETQKAAMLELLDVLGTDEYGFVHAVYLYNLRQTTPASEPNDKKSNWYGITFGGAYEHLPAWQTFVDAIQAYDGTPEPNSAVTTKSVSGESATFSFSADDPTSVFSCQLDGGSWTACSSPKAYAPTGGGSHTFKVRATNAEAIEVSPADYSWVTPPGATTETATGVKGTEAVLNGSVNPRATATTYYFEYGTTNAYGSVVPLSAKAVGGGTGAVKVSEPITGLSGNTTYHFRVVAENKSGGVTKGTDLTLKTAKTMESSLSSLPLIEPFDGSTGFGSGPFMPSIAWGKFPWASSRGQDTTTGWGPYTAAPAVDGAYFASEPPAYNDSPSGAAVSGTIAAGPTVSGQFISVWLVDILGIFANPKGYELRMTQKGSGQYDVTLFKVTTTGTFPMTTVRTTLASASNYSLSSGSKIALADSGGTVSVWIDQGTGFQQVLSAGDAAYSKGYVGLSGSGTAGRLVNFKGGSL